MTTLAIDQPQTVLRRIIHKLVHIRISANNSRYQYFLEVLHLLIRMLLLSDAWLSFDFLSLYRKGIQLTLKQNHLASCISPPAKAMESWVMNAIQVYIDLVAIDLKSKYSRWHPLAYHDVTGLLAALTVMLESSF